VLGWGATIAGGALLLGGGVVGLWTLSARASYLDECGGGTACADQAALARAQDGQRFASTLRTVSSVLLVAGAVVGASGIALVTLAPKTTRSAGTSFYLGPGTLSMRTGF
jgi:hypothetical protein